jgi:hypothetical protein
MHIILMLKLYYNNIYHINIILMLKLYYDNKYRININIEIIL